VLPERKYCCHYHNNNNNVMLIATVVNSRDMERRGEGPQIWGVATCTSNNQPRTANKGLSSGWGGVNNPHHKKQHATKSYTGSRTDSLDRPTQKENRHSVGTRNVRSLYRTTSTKTLNRRIF
jgi:hypothetical protein